MLEVKSYRKSKMNKKQYLLVLAALVGGLSLTSPMATKVYAEEEVLYEDDTDDYKTEDIKEDDVVRDNTVVPSEEQKQEEPKQEEQKPEEKQEENKNDGGSCVTPDNGYDEKAGEYWDPNIKTEEEKKVLVPDTPPETPETPETPKTPETPETPETPKTPETPETPQPTPTPAPTPAPAPKTGDLTMAEIIKLLAGLGVTIGGLGYVAGNVAYNKTKKRK